MRRYIIAAWVIVTIILAIMVVRLNGRMYDAEERLAWTHAAVVIYLTPDDDYVKCAAEIQMRNKMSER